MVSEKKVQISIIWLSILIFTVLVAVLWFAVSITKAEKAEAKIDEFVIATNDNGEIWYLQSNGDGTFANKTRIAAIGPPSGANVRGVAIADFDNDKKYDFVTGDSNGAIYLFKNTGVGTFSSTTVVSGLNIGSTPYVMDFAVADFNGDGYYDFVVSGNSNVIYVFTNNKNSTFNYTAITATWAATLHGKDAGEYNNDTFKDFIISDGSGKTYLYTSNGTINFTTRPVVSTSIVDDYALASGDFNNDGKLDIVTSGGTPGKLYLWIGSGDGNFTLSGEIYDFGDKTSVDAYDFDNDGNADIAGSLYNNAIYFMRGKGNGQFDTPTIISSGFELGHVLGISAPSIAPTGKPIARTGKNQTVSVNQGVTFNGTSSTDPNGDIVEYNWSFGDGSDGTGMLTAHTYTRNGVYIANLTVTDNTGYKSIARTYITVKNYYQREYIVTGNDSGGLYIYPSKEDGTFETKKLVDTIGSNVRGIGIADFDNDTDYDFIAASGDGNVYLFVNDGGENFTKMRILKCSNLFGNVNVASTGRVLSSAGHYNDVAGGVWYTSGTSNYNPFNLVDGDKSTSYNAYWLENEASSSLYVDIYSKKSIGKIVLDNHNLHATTCSYTVYYNNNDWDGSWATVGSSTWAQVDAVGSSGSLATDASATITLNTYTSTRFIRVDVTKTGGSYAVLNEIEIYDVPYVMNGGPFGTNTAMDVAVGDFNNDGYNDFIVSGLDTKLRVFINNRDCTFTLSQEITCTSNVYGKAVGDFVGNNSLDILVGCKDKSTYLFEGNGNGTFTAKADSFINLSGKNIDEPFTLTVGDFNNDSHLDILVGGDSDGKIWLYLGNATKGGWPIDAGLAYSFVSNYQSGKAYDFENDGILDVIVIADTNNSIYKVKGNGDGTFRTTADKIIMPDLIDNATGKALGVAVPNAPYPNKPTANAGTNKSGYINTPISFDGSASSSNATQYIWNFGDGTTGYGAVLQHNYTRNGVYAVILTVDDQYGYAGSSRITVTAKAPSRQEFVITTNDAGEIYYLTSNGDGTFGDKRLIYALGTNSRGVSIADFDGDYDYDFIVGTYTGTTTKGEIYLYQNDGYQNFTKNKIATGIALGGNYANDFAVGDFNNDSYPDFIFSGNDNILRIFLNNRDGAFSQSAITTSWESSRLLGKDVGDFNNDGKIDLIVGGYGAVSSYGNVYIYAGNGNGTFTNYWKVLNVSGDNEVRTPWTLISGDFNNDGKLDLIVGGDGDTNDDNSASSNSTSDGRAHLYIGDGNGNFTYSKAAYDFIDTYQSADAYDFDGDGNLDIIVATYTNKSLFLVRGKGNGLFSTRFDRLVMPNLITYNVGNVLGIAAPCLPPADKPIAAISSQTIFLDDTATFNATASTCTNGIGNYSWNFGDSGTDYGNTTTHKYSKNGVYNVTLVLTDEYGYKSVGRIAVTVRIYTPKEFIVVSNDAGELYCFNISSNGALENGRLIVTMNANIKGVAISDFDADGDYDFVTADSSNNAYIFINDGTETFSRYVIGADYPSGTLTFSSIVMGFAAGDLNGDGYPDFVMSGNNNILRIFMNNKDGTFEQSVITGSSGTRYRAKVIVDINGDGLSDILASDDNKNVYVFTGTSNGAFGSGSKLINLSSDLSSVQLTGTDNIYTLQCADFDGDKQTDIIVGGSTNGRVWLYTGDGKGNFTYVRQAYNFTAYLQSAVPYDVDKDGFLDLISVSYDDHAIYFIKGGSNGMFYQQTPVSSDIGTARAIGISAPPIRSVPANFNVWGDGGKSGFSGDAIVYNLTVENNCSMPDIIDISYTSKYGFSYSTYRVAADGPNVLLNDTDNDGIVDTGTLSRNGGRISIAIALTVPPSALAGTVDVLNVTLTSSIDKITSKKMSIETTVKTTPKISMTTGLLTKDGRLGSVVIYNITIKNEGNVQDTINVNVSGNTWSTRLFQSDGITALTNTNPGADAIVDIGAVPPGSNKSMIVEVTIPDIPSKLSDSAAISIQSSADSTKNSTITLTTNSNHIGISGNVKTAVANQNETISLLFWVTNAGESGVVDITFDSSNKWSVSITHINGSDLIDTNHNGVLDIGNISEGGMIPIMANITIPSNVAGGAIEKTTINILSPYGKIDTITLTTTVNRPNVTLIAPAVPQSGIPGSKCSYGITVVNNGNTVDTINIEASSVLNWLVQLYGENGALLNDSNGDSQIDLGSLEPGASRTFTAIVSIPPGAQASAINNATITASSSINRNVKYAVYLSTASLQYVGFDLGTNQSKNGDPGSTIFYSVVVRNNGNDKDTIKLKTTVSLPNWYITLLKNDYVSPLGDTDGDKIEDTGELSPGRSIEVVVRVVIPSNETAYVVEKTKLNGTSARNSYITNTIEIATTVNVAAKISVVLNSTAARKVDIGGSAAYYLDIVNNGNFKDTIDLEINNTSPGWKVSLIDMTSSIQLSDSDLSSFPDTGILNVQEKTTIIVKITAPSASIANYTDATTITARSAADKLKFERIALSTGIKTSAKIEITVDNISKSTNPGELASYLINITNSGANPDTFDVFILGNNWSVNTSGTSNEFLNDTNSNGNVDTGTVLNGNSVSIVARVFVPADTVAQTTDNAVIRFVSNENSSVINSITLTTIASRYGYLSTTPDLDVGADPNENFTRTININNLQNYDDSIGLIPKGMPDKWNLSFYTEDWTPIRDTNQDSILDIGTIRIGGNAKIRLVISVPSSAIHGSQNTIEVGIHSVIRNSIVNTTHILIEINKPDICIKDVLFPKSVFEGTTPIRVIIENDGAYVENIVVNVTSSTGGLIGATVIPSLRRGQSVVAVVDTAFMETGSSEFKVSIEGAKYDANVLNKSMKIDVAPTSNNVFSSAGLAFVVVIFAVIIALVSVLFVRQNIMRKYDEWRTHMTGGKRFKRPSYISKYDTKEYSPYTTPTDDSTAYKAYETYVPMAPMEGYAKTPSPTEPLGAAKIDTKILKFTEKEESVKELLPVEPVMETKKEEAVQPLEKKELEKPSEKPKEEAVPLKVDAKILNFGEKKEATEELPPIEPLTEIRGKEVAETVKKKEPEAPQKPKDEEIVKKLPPAGFPREAKKKEKFAETVERKKAPEAPEKPMEETVPLAIDTKILELSKKEEIAEEMPSIESLEEIEEEEVVEPMGEKKLEEPSEGKPKSEELPNKDLETGRPGSEEGKETETKALPKRRFVIKKKSD